MEQLFYWQARNNPPLATDVYQRPTMFTGRAAPIFFNRRINQPPAQLPNGKVIKRVLALFFFSSDRRLEENFYLSPREEEDCRQLHFRFGFQDFHGSGWNGRKTFLGKILIFSTHRSSEAPPLHLANFPVTCRMKFRTLANLRPSASRDAAFLSHRGQKAVYQKEHRSQGYKVMSRN